MYFVWHLHLNKPNKMWMIDSCLPHRSLITHGNKTAPTPYATKPRIDINGVDEMFEMLYRVLMSPTRGEEGGHTI